MLKKIIIAGVALAALYSCSTRIKTKSMNPNEWKHHTNIYEVNVRQYTPEGTFRAFEKELPRLHEMGVETLWFMPITPIAQKEMKGTMGSPYAAQSYVKINPEFGTLADFKSVVKAAHKLGMNVIIDWVANHTGWDHEWTVAHPDFYKHDEDGSFHRASGMDDIIELDYRNPAMRQAMIDAMKFWLTEIGIDGFRCDLASWVTVDFWKQARPELEKIKPLFFLGEFDELDSPEYGKVFDVSYSWRWMHKTKDYADGNTSLQDLRNLLIEYSRIGDHSQRAWFTSNHDENSWNGTEYEKYGILARPLAVFSATWNGTPLMYSGQELPNKKRLAFFDEDAIAWTGTYELADFYQTLYDLKRNNPALRGGDSEVATYFINTSNPDQILAFLRKKEDHEVLVFLNMSQGDVTFKAEDAQATGKYTNAFNKLKVPLDLGTEIKLKAGDFLLLSK